MEVAQEVPFLTGQYSTTNGTGSAFQTIEREEVGTILTVTPTINEGDAVLLKLQIESSSLARRHRGRGRSDHQQECHHHQRADQGRQHAGARRPDPGQRHQQRELGAAARPASRSSASCSAPVTPSKTKTDFLIFLQPHILRDDRQAAIETDAKYNYLRDEQRRLNKDQDAKLPLLPFAAGGRAAGHPQRRDARAGCSAQTISARPATRTSAQSAAATPPQRGHAPRARPAATPQRRIAAGPRHPRRRRWHPPPRPEEPQP